MKTSKTKLNQYGVPESYKGSVPARCNKRACQARRNLSKYPELYQHWPKCRECPDGKMYVDKFRLQARFDKEKYIKDLGETCKCDGAHFPHRKGSVPLCHHYEEVQVEKTLTKGTFKHSPDKREELDDDLEKGEVPF